MKSKEEALDRTPWGTGFGRVCGPIVRQIIDNLLSLQGGILTVLWAGAEHNLLYPISVPRGSDKRYWSHKITSLDVLIYVACSKIGHSNAWHVIIDGFCNVNYE